ncbi:venom acid phosphatase Acph-1-like [Leptopilina heterotoma]|uniref:venom acid phosphatase Acph-1-like n=1 Tax=Leptopilina heterotoma TaxID=63436 RepID=UPI001CA93269|nr:venom acid phosphatase Acph-1-like [Leptopilina heterotoma]
MKIVYYLAASVFIFITLSLTIYLVLQFVYSDDDEKPQLELTIVVFRNGERMPYTDAGEGYKNNPNVENNYFPMGQSGLTNEGKLNEYKLGQTLREKYKDFLNSTYQYEFIEARSTIYDSTKVSLQLVLAGLYPPDSSQIWNSSIKWQPIPFEYEPETDDILLTSIKCSRYLEELKNLKQTIQVKEKLQKFENLIQNLSNITGEKINNLSDLYKIHFTLEMEEKMNLKLPNWTKYVLNNTQVMEAILFNFELMTYNNLMKKLSTGSLINKIADEMIRIKDNLLRKKTKIYLYSGHHDNLINLLSTLGVYKLHIPKFSSAIMIELHKLNNQYFVQILYYSGIPSKIEILEIPGCLKLCPLDEFLELMKPVLPEKNENVCIQTS